MTLLSEYLATINTAEGRRRLAAYLQSLPYPHFEPASVPGHYMRIDQDGTHTLGKFVGRVFKAVASEER